MTPKRLFYTLLFYNLFKLQNVKDTKKNLVVIITFKLHSDSQTDVPKVIKTNGAMSIRIQFIQDSLQVMTVIAVSCVLHRSTNRVIHWLGLYTRAYYTYTVYYYTMQAACQILQVLSDK